MTGERALLIESENLLMKMKIEKLEFELESEKIRSRHFEGISLIAMTELEKEIAKGNRLNDKSFRLSKLFHDFEIEMKHIEDVKVKMVNSIDKLSNIVRSMNVILQ